MVADGGAITGSIQAIDGIGDQSIHGLCGGDEGVDTGRESNQVGIEIIIRS